MFRELLCIWTDRKSLNGWNFLKDILFRETELVEISVTASRVNSQLTHARMRRDESEICKYQRIQLLNNKFISLNVILRGTLDLAWRGMS